MDNRDADRYTRSGSFRDSYNFVFGWLHPFAIDTSSFALGVYSYVLGALIALGSFRGRANP